MGTNVQHHFRWLMVVFILAGLLGLQPALVQPARAAIAPQGPANLAAGGQTCQVLQPGPTPGKDAYIKQEKPDERRGSDSELRVKNENGKLMRSLLQFDFSGLPSGAVVVSATLSLYVKGASGGAVTINAHQVTAAWNEAQVSWKARDKAASQLWATQGGDFNATVVGSTSIDDTKNVWRSWNLTSLAATWASNPASNLGVILEAPVANPKTEKIFRSSDDGAASQRPMLEVCYNAGVTVEPDNSGDGVAGLTRTYAHVVSVGTLNTAVGLTAVSSQAWTTRIYQDVDGDGVKDPEDTQITATPVLNNASFPILVQVDVPAAAPAGMADITTVTATAQTGGASDTATDRTQVGALITVTPSNTAKATAGTVLFYGHHIVNNGAAADCMVVTVASSQGWTVLLWEDQNHNGVHEVSNPNEPAAPATVCINPGAAYYLVAEIRVPSDATAGTVNQTLITATSGNDPSKSGKAIDTTEVFVNTPPVIDGKYDSTYETSPDATLVCYNNPAGVLFGKLASFYQPTSDSVSFVLAIDKDFVDNTYGVNAVGWANGHTYGNLVGSDHAQFYGYDANGTLVLDFKVDYITAATGRPSGYASLGVTGGEGRVNIGTATDFTAWGTSIDYALNQTGYCTAGNCSAGGTNLLVDSPATDAFYTVNATYPNWIYDVIYEVKVKKSAFGAAGFGSLEVPYIHASPSKLSTNTIYAEPGICPSEIGDTVYNDLNKNGLQDAGEAGISGVQVKLYRDNGDGALDPATDTLVGTQTTNINGKYLFQNLAPNDYFVDVVDATVPSGYKITTFNDPTGIINLAENTSYLSADFGYALGPQIGDRVWNDADKDGIQDAGEAGVDGATVNLYDGAGGLLATTATDSNGYYSFPDWPAGAYQVEFQAPFGYFFSPKDQGANDAVDSDADPTTGRTATFSFDGNTADLTRDAGLYYQAPACDVVSSIASNFNGTAIAAGNTIWFNSHLKVSGLPSGTTTIYFDGSSVQFTANSTPYNLTVPRGKVIFSATATSATTAFDAATQTWTTTVPRSQAGDIFLAGFGFVVPTGGLPGGINPVTWSGRFSSDRAGVTVSSWQWAAAVYTSFSANYNALGVQAVDGTYQAGAPVNYRTFVTGGARGGGGSNYTGSNSGTGSATPCPTAKIGDFVWFDTNANGIQDGSEAGIADATVQLFDNADQLVAQATTGANGLYSFIVPAGSYYEHFTAPTGYVLTLQDQGANNATDSDPNPSDGKTATFNLNYGASDLTWDAGVTTGITIGDYVWNDINGDGIQNDGPGLGINGVIVRLYRDNGNGTFEPSSGDTLVVTATTSGDGGYLFTGLQPGAYWVDVDDASSALTGYTLINGLQSGPDPKLVTVNAGDNYTQADFGYVGKGIISGAVFYDWDADGTQALGGEAPLSGVEICAYRDTNWNDTFDGAAIDTLVGCATTDAQGAYVLMNQVAGQYLLIETQPANLTDTTPNMLIVQLIVIGSGGSAPDNNFGEIIYVRLGDMVYVDLNGNGVQDASSETTGLAGVELQLTGTDIRGESVNWTTVTVGNGHYLTDTLLPGTYTVKAPAQFGGFQLTSLATRMTTLTTVITEDLTLDFGYIFPTNVGVYEFKAMLGRGQVTLSWLAFGPQPPSFHVLRADNSKSVGAVQVTTQPVTSGTGAYQFVDRGVVAGQTYWYTLEDANSGQMYGPLAVTVTNLSIRTFLPSVSR